MSAAESLHPTHEPHPHVDPKAGTRRIVAALGLAAALMFVGAYFLPWWSFHLVAPQYPMGLNLHIALSGVTGDVKEIDILNHYIGMQSMAAAASTERALSTWLVGATGLVVALGILVAGKRMSWFALVPALGLPVGFVADTLVWMYKFGHELSDEAPIHFEPFMPVIVGKGMVGQFHTTAWPAAGFLLAVGALVVTGVAVFLRRRVCNACPLAEKCGATCPTGFVVPPKAV